MNKYTNAAVPLSPIVFRVPLLFYIGLSVVYRCVFLRYPELSPRFNFQPPLIFDSSSNFGYLECVSQCIVAVSA